MIARRDEVILQPDGARTKVDVRKRGVEGHEQDVADDRTLGKAAQRQRDHDQTARDDDVEKVRARTRDPVHGADRVMHGVKAPQHRDLVEHPMHGVLRQIRHENDRQELQDERPIADIGLKLRDCEPRSRQCCGQQHQEIDQLRREVRRDEIECVGGPLRAERSLAGMQRPDSLQRNKNDGHDEQVQHEPIQTDSVLGGDFLRQRHAPASQCQRSNRKGRGGERQNFALT